MSTHTVGQRGPAEHARREQIIEAANEHFRHYGYAKTTVADLAKAIGLSTAYIYKFFDSKKAIGEAICGICLGKMLADLQEVADDGKSAADRLRRFFRVLAHGGSELFFHDRKLHDLTVAAQEEQWEAVRRYDAMLLEIVRRIVRDGREAGEFERKTPLDEVCHAILLALQPFKHPILLAQNLDSLNQDVAVLSGLVLRSLVP
jgi:AcrR family transcriptional regulator